MTREEARETLEFLKIMDAPKLREAVDMAIEALQERPKGRWNKETMPLGWQEVDVATCSVCGESWILGEDGDCAFEDIAEMWDFCPNCGADMRESE